MLWPVEGVAERVPVDLAGLPAFDRERRFSGFNGFGIARTADAVPDTDPPADAAPRADAAPSADAAPRDTEASDGSDDGGENGATEDAPPPAPVAAPGDAPASRDTSDDRPKGLAPHEQKAFHAIGERLADGGTNARGTEREDESDDDARLPDARPGGGAPGGEEARNEGSRPKGVAPDPQPIPSAFAGTVRVAEVRDVDTSILARLPIPVLAYRADTLLFANAEFFRLTRYASLHELADAGGLIALFGGEEEVEGASIYDRDGHALDVAAHLQRVPWDRERATLLTLRRGEEGGGYDDPDDGSDDPDDDPGDGSRGNGADPDGRPGSTTGGGSGGRRMAASDRAVPPSNDAVATSAPGTVVAAAPTASATPPDATARDATVRDATARDAIVARPASRPATSVGGEAADHPFAKLDHADLRNILDTATDGVVILDDDGRIQGMNRSAEALFEAETASLSGQPFTRLLAPESHRSADDYLAGLSGTGVASVLNDGREVIGRVTGRRGEASGEPTLGHNSAAPDRGLVPLFLTIGRLERGGFCAVLRDITVWKKSEEELVTARAEAEQASLHKTQFLSTLSHEIRTPLNAILGFSDLMLAEQSGPLGSERYRGYVRDVRRSGEFIHKLVSDLLDISKIEAGRMPLEFQPVPLNVVVTETVAMSQPQANAERVIIRTSLGHDVPDVVADDRSMRQVVTNLLSNALRFTEPGGQVIVSTAYDEGEVWLRVRDTGIGMSEEEVEQALKPFQQIGSPERHRAEREGSGLGLPLTKVMTEANRARFSLSSRPNEGTLVEVRFPAQRVLVH